MFDLHTPPANSIVRIKQRQSLVTQMPPLNTSSYNRSSSKPSTPQSYEAHSSSSISKRKSSVTPNSDSSNVDDALSPAVTMRSRKGYKAMY